MTRNDAVNILMVDDQPAKLMSYEAVLGELGENLVRANSATEAMEFLLKSDTAVVLMDVCMPDVDGFELANLIRQHPRCQRTSIILISAIHLTDLDRLRGYESGAVDYIPVPVVPEILKAKVGVFADLYRKTVQLETLNRELEQRVAERTAVLEAQSEKLREADRRKDHFLALLAHELRNPLAPIASAARVLRMKAPPDSDFIWVQQVIERQVDHLKRLVDDLLDVNRISRNKLELQRERVDLASVLSTTIETNRPLIEQRNHRLNLDVPKQQVFLFGDPVRLTQVFGNLLNNSAKFTDPGGVISLSAELENDTLAVRIRDNGIGLAPEELEHISEPFYQANSSSNKWRGGLGVGLSLVWQLVEMHGGSISARSEGVGKGCEFVVRLPVLADARPDPVQVLDAPLSKPEKNGAGLRIVIADDNADSAAALALNLQLDGHIVETAEDGLKALGLADWFHPDVMLLDIGMPELSGYDVARQVRTREWSKNTLLVAQTGWGRPEDRRQSEESGFNAHLTKPVDYDVLRKLLESSATKRNGKYKTGFPP